MAAYDVGPGKVLFGLAVFALTVLVLVDAGVRLLLRRRREPAEDP